MDNAGASECKIQLVPSPTASKRRRLKGVLGMWRARVPVAGRGAEEERGKKKEKGGKSGKGRGSGTAVRG